MGGAARQEGTASNEMCTFLIINISSLHLYTHEYDCIQEPVWKRKSHSHCRACPGGYLYQHSGCGDIPAGLWTGRFQAVHCSMPKETVYWIQQMKGGGFMFPHRSIFKANQGIGKDASLL